MHLNTDFTGPSYPHFHTLYYYYCFSICFSNSNLLCTTLLSRPPLSLLSYLLPFPPIFLDIYQQ